MEPPISVTQEELPQAPGPDADPDHGRAELVVSVPWSDDINHREGKLRNMPCIDMHIWQYMIYCVCYYILNNMIFGLSENVVCPKVSLVSKPRCLIQRAVW